MHDESILLPIAALGPDLTAHEWSSRLAVPIEDVFEAAKRTGVVLKSSEPVKKTPAKNRTQRLYDLLREGVRDVEALAETARLTPSSVRKKLKHLEALGFVQHTGTGAYARWSATR